MTRADILRYSVQVFKQFCDNLLWPCLQLKCLCVQLGKHGDLLVLVDKLLASLFHRLVLLTTSVYIMGT